MSGGSTLGTKRLALDGAYEESQFPHDGLDGNLRYVASVAVLMLVASQVCQKHFRQSGFWFGMYS